MVRLRSAVQLGRMQAMHVLSKMGRQKDADRLVPLIRDEVDAVAVEHFVHDTALLEQVSVVDPGRTVKDLLFGTGVHITGFVRLELGSGRP